MQLYGAIFDDVFCSGCNFRKSFWELNLDNNCGEYLDIYENL